MKRMIVWSVARAVMTLFLLFLATRWITNPYPASFESYAQYPFGKGNAPESVRSEVIDRMRLFQAGYAKRDAAEAAAFADSLMARDNILILGTMPREVFVGHDEATALVRNDWAEWGDCTFLIDTAHVSSSGQVAWVATVGYVEFDLSRFLVLPLRLTGVLVHEDGAWRFQQLQYQFDLDLSFNLLLVVVLALLALGSVVSIPVQIHRSRSAHFRRS